MSDSFPASSGDGASLNEASDRFRGEQIRAREFVSIFALRLQFFLQQCMLIIMAGRSRWALAIEAPHSTVMIGVHDHTQ